MEYKVEAGNLNAVGNRGAILASRPTNEHVLDSITFALSPAASPGVLDTIARREIFHTLTEVTGEIIDYKIRLNDEEDIPWGAEVLVGDRFYVKVWAKYYAPSPMHTRMDLTVWKPSGEVITANDDDLWPYESPGDLIEFRIRSIWDSWNIREVGLWEAKVEYVWVE